MRVYALPPSHFLAVWYKYTRGYVYTFFFGERRKFASVQQQQVLVRMRQKTQNFFSSFAFALHCSGINSRRSRICGRTLLFHTLLSVWLGDDWNVSTLAFFGKPDGGEFLWLHDNFSSALMHFWCFYVSTHHIQMYADETFGSWIARWSYRDCDMLRKFSAVVHRLILFSLGFFFCGNNFGWHLFYSVCFLCEVLLVLTRIVAGNPTSTTRPLDVCEFFFGHIMCCVFRVCRRSASIDIFDISFVRRKYPIYIYFLSLSIGFFLTGKKFLLRWVASRFFCPVPGHFS